MKTTDDSLQASQELVALADMARPIVRTFRSFRRVARIADSLPDDLAALLRSSPDALLDRGELLRSNGARRTARVDWNGQSFVLKHYVEPSWRHALKQTILRSRASTTWAFTHRLANAGVATPRPVACIENRWGLMRLDSYLMYPYIEGCTLRTYFAGEAKQCTSLHDRLWQQLGAVWERLVELRVSLGDTNLGNFILCPAGRLWLIDLDKSRFHRRTEAAARGQERAWKQLLRSAGKC